MAALLLIFCLTSSDFTLETDMKLPFRSKRIMMLSKISVARPRMSASSAAKSLEDTLFEKVRIIGVIV
ncbi:hypothetical protein D3C73_1487820 [compost metagenome]